MQCAYNPPIDTLLKQLCIAKLVYINNIQRGEFMYSCRTDTLLITLQALFNISSALPCHHARHFRDPHIIARKTIRATITCIDQCPKPWLALPEHVHVKE